MHEVAYARSLWNGAPHLLTPEYAALLSGYRMRSVCRCAGSLCMSVGASVIRVGVDRCRFKIACTPEFSEAPRARFFRLRFVTSTDRLRVANDGKKRFEKYSFVAMKPSEPAPRLALRLIMQYRGASERK